MTRRSRGSPLAVFAIISVVFGLTPCSRAEGQSVSDDQGRVVSTRDAAGRQTRYRYREDGRLAAIVDTDGRVRVLVYDEKGNWLGWRGSDGHFEPAAGRTPTGPR